MTHGSEWDIVVCQTTLTSAVIRNLSPQLWHQFRITAVNIHGSQAPSEPSPPFNLLLGTADRVSTD